MRASYSAHESTFDTTLTALTVLSVLLALGSVGYTVAVPRQEAPYTTASLLSETNEEEFVAADYPREFLANESRSLYFAVENQEYEQLNYTLVVQLQRVSTRTNEVAIRDRIALYRTTLGVEHGETVRHRSTITPEWTGTDLRLVYLLYRSDPPENPTTESAYRSLTLGINVTTDR